MKTPVLIALSVVTMALFSCNNNAQQSASANNQLPAAPTTADAGKPDAKAIFMANCASCHNPIKDATGPALQGALARWNGDRNGIKAFIHNSAKMIADGDKHAVAVFNKYNRTSMTAFPTLTDGELDVIIDNYMK